METKEWNWKTRDNLSMYSRSWSPTGQMKAVVCLIHGLGEHTGRYEHVGEAFSEAGYALVGCDLRGHGNSAGPRGHIPSYQALMDDISAFIEQVKQKYPEKPLFLYGHSLGGNLVLNYALRIKPKIQGVISSSAWLELAFQPPASKVNLAKLMVKILPSFSQPNGLEIAALAREPSVIEAYKNDPLVHDKISASLFLNIYEAGLWALEHASEFPLPLLMIHGTADRLSSVEGTRKFARAAGKKVKAVYLEGWYHETHNEAEKAEVFKYMTTWMDEQLG